MLDFDVLFDELQQATNRLPEQCGTISPEQLEIIIKLYRQCGTFRAVFENLEEEDCFTFRSPLFPESSSKRA